MAKFSSSRSKTARNPGPVGRVKTFSQAKNRGTDSPRSRKNNASNDGPRRKTRNRTEVDRMDFTQASDYVREEPKWKTGGLKGGHSAGQARNRIGNRGGNHPQKKDFNPLSFLRKDEEDGVVSLPSMEYVEMNDRDFSTLGKRENHEERSGDYARQTKRRGDKNEAIFRRSLRGSKIAGKFMKDFRDAGAPHLRPATNEKKPTPRKPTLKQHGMKSGSRKITDQSGERLQKVLATAGFGSRRDCEQFIITGRVMVDRTVVTELGTRVTAEQTIHLDGELVRRPKKFVYYALNKPGNVICTNDDPDGRRRALDYIHEKVPGLFPVGRLDLHSEGLLLITNDGELANRLTHPSYEVPKVYRVRVSGTPTKAEIAQICKGVYLSEGFAKAEEVYLKHVYREGTAVLEITLREGRNREIRRILARVGHNVLDLVRISIGDVKLGKLAVGEYRPLTTQEVRSLKKLVGLTDTKSEILAASSVSKKVTRAEDAPKKTQKVQKKPKIRKKLDGDKAIDATESVQKTESTPETITSAEELYETWKAEMN